MTFVCKHCNANFNKKYNLSRHQLTQHQQNNVDNKFECNECHRKLNCKDILIRHIEILHKLDMGPVKQKVFYIWHVHEAWRKNLLKINNKEKRISVRKILYDLSKELDEEAFKNKLYTFLSNIDEDLQKFLGYFFQYYGQNPQYWAYCYRQYAGCNTNMNLESFYRVLKEKIICRLKVKSVYNCYIIFLHGDIKPLSFNSWHIKSFTDEKIYIVLKTKLKECSICSDHSKNNIEMAQDQQQVQHLEDDLHIRMMVRKYINFYFLLDNLRNKTLKEIELSLQNINRKLIVPIHAFISASNIETVALTINKNRKEEKWHFKKGFLINF
ncbi:C2H2-type domain-containing protein [Aphis craccivora]|uniref:C2H2-type domain-containing protein n=1 Tax=Aphis craccivora TaxID=307492 RepID=A0A6G0YJB4_APHCR|nr:C2H2-type domain-containing protein [Aphis craccivora]